MNSNLLEADFWPAIASGLPVARHSGKLFTTQLKMRRYPVGTKLNNSQNEGAEPAPPVTLDTPIQAQLF